MAVRQDASTGQLVDDGNTPEQDKTKPAADVIRVKVWSPFRVFFDGEAKSISAVNGTGPFDVLPKHHNFITLLDPCELQVVAEPNNLQIRIGGGIMHVRSNAVTVFLEV